MGDRACDFPGKADLGQHVGDLALCELGEALHALARNFDAVAVPEHGRYVGQPARADESGVTYVPPKA